MPIRNCRVYHFIDQRASYIIGKWLRRTIVFLGVCARFADVLRATMYDSSPYLKWPFILRDLFLSDGKDD